MDGPRFDLPTAEANEFLEFEYSMRSNCAARAPAQAALSEYLRAIGSRHPDQCASNLLDDFGTVAAVLSGSLSSLKRVVEESTAIALIASRNLMSVALLEPLRERPVIDDEVLFRFVKFTIGSLTRERLLAIYLDERRKLLSIECIADGSISDVEVNIVTIIHRALDVGAAGFILVHNHPSGDPMPSNADVVVTRRLAWAARDLNLTLFQHLVVSQAGVASVIHS